MKLVPLTNGTPDNALHILVVESATGLEGRLGRLLCSDGIVMLRDRMFATDMVWIYGPAFRKLKDDAGPMAMRKPRLTIEPGGVPVESAGYTEYEIARTARQLCEHLEQRLQEAANKEVSR